MKIISMAETVLRSSIRTPSILQQQQQQQQHHHHNNPVALSPLSPTPSTTTQTSNTSGSATAAPSTPTSAANRLQFIKQRKLDLEKVLNEKSNLLQQLCRQEAQIVGIYPIGEYGGKSLDQQQLQQDTASMASATLRRKVGTGFKLPENLLNHKEDDVNKLLLGKQIQQQISEASLKLANDLTQTKSIRRTHKQNYEVAQQKLQTINQNLNQLVKRHNYDAVVNAAYAQQLHQAAKKSSDGYHNSAVITNTTSVDDLNNVTAAHAKYSGNGNSSSSQSLHINTATDYQKAVKLHNNNNNNNNNNNINNNNSQSSPMLAATVSSSGLLMERRNSMLSTNSQLQLAASTATAAAAAASMSSPSKQRVRHDSYNAEYVGKLSPSLSYHYHHVHYGGGSSSGGAGASGANSIGHGHFTEYPTANVASKVNNNANAMRRLHHPVEQPHFGAAYSPGSGGATPADEIAHNDDYQPMDYYYQSPMPVASDGSTRPDDKENFYGTPPVARYVVSPDDGNASNDGQSMKMLQPQGLGGYWATLDNGERIWCSVDNKFSSLDRKVGGNMASGCAQLQQQAATKLRKQQPVVQSHLLSSIKTSTSLGNFEFFSSGGNGGWPASDDMTADAISVTSTSSDQKRLKEKQWLETALDGPTMRMKQHSVSPSPPPSVLNVPTGAPLPPLYHRDKKKLSSHSMHSPGRSTNYMYDKQPYPLPADAIVANATLPIHIMTTKQTVQPPQHYPSEFYLNTGVYPDYHHHHQQSNVCQSPQLSPFGHVSPSPPPLPPSSSASKQQQQPPQSSPNRQHQIVRRTASSVSAITSISTATQHNPAMSPPNGALSPPMSGNSGGVGSGEIRIESPKNMTVIQQAKFQPYKEVSKPFEMSDFYKYSTKFRKKPDATTASVAQPTTQQQQPPKATYQTAAGQTVQYQQ